LDKAPEIRLTGVDSILALLTTASLSPLLERPPHPIIVACPALFNSNHIPVSIWMDQTASAINSVCLIGLKSEKTGCTSDVLDALIANSPISRETVLKTFERFAGSLEWPIRVY
jgi:hypothetical protein